MKRFLDGGNLVPDDTMISLIGEEIKKQGDNNWLLDGASD